ncbi:hypothetical protein CEXT_778311 [Caerostris extrusa]|uniref:Uncharacterized protein n=1 Tax=Caerostris extrusa TaxID=172846 RepID=A0AAV4RAC0_CAEEX|nr:hypothetical protein CEXT_778311 [Caerostris extrusa]
MFQQGLQKFVGPALCISSQRSQVIGDGDYRALNKVTITDRYFPTFPTNCGSVLHGKKFSINLVLAYQQIPVHEADIFKNCHYNSFMGI